MSEENIRQLMQNQNNILTFGGAIVGVIVTSAVNMNANMVSSSCEIPIQLGDENQKVVSWCVQHILAQYGLKITITYLLIMIVLPCLFYIMYWLSLMTTQEILLLTNAEDIKFQQTSEYIKVLEKILLVICPAICIVNIFIYSVYLKDYSPLCKIQDYKEFLTPCYSGYIAIFFVIYVVAYFLGRSQRNLTLSKIREKNNNRLVQSLIFLTTVLIVSSKQN